MTISNQEMHDLREASLLLLTDSATILRLSTEDDGYLGTIDTWSELATAVPCRVAEVVGAGERESTQAGRITSAGEHVVRFPYGTDIHEADRVVVTVNAQERTFDVARVIEHSYATTTSVVCSEAR